MFTAGVIAEQLSVDKDTIDDLLDELEEHVSELVFHEGIQSWLYEFKSPLIWRYYNEALSPAAGRQLARGLGELLEKRYAGRGVDYAIKASRLWLEAGDTRRYVSLLGLAGSAERLEILQMGVEMVRTYPESPYPKPLYKALHLTFFEKAAPIAPPDQVPRLIDEMQAWAEKHDDVTILPWLDLHRARLMQRTGKLKEAADYAKQAQSGFARRSNPVKEAEAIMVLAFAAQASGDFSPANEHAARALRTSNFSPLRDRALCVQGSSLKFRGQLQNALHQLREALAR